MAQDAVVVDAVAKYFYFICLDERQSIRASLKVLSELKTHNWLDQAHRAKWIESLHKWKEKLLRQVVRSEQMPVERNGFSIPHEFDLNAWLSFLTATDSSEVEAVVLSRLLSFSDDEIAEGLGVTLGTVRYRVGRGLRHLGGFVEP